MAAAIQFSLLRANLSGLVGAERMIFSALLAREGATVVENGNYDMLLVDSGHPDFGDLVHKRAAGSVAIAVCDEPRRDEEGVVSLHRPLHTEKVREVLSSIQGSLHRTNCEASRGRAGQPLALRDLAARYRFELARLNTSTVTIQGRIFHLFPQRYIYVSEHSPEFLHSFRSAGKLDIGVIADAKDAEQAATAASCSAPRRLDEFLWHLGLSSAGGQLLPWLQGEHVYRLTRWPSVVRRNNDANQVRLATLIARRTLCATEICHATGIPYESVADILNGCSLSGCLEGYVPAEAPVTKSSPTKNSSIASLLGRIRLKLGLT